MQCEQLKERATHYANLVQGGGWWKYVRQHVADIEANDPTMRGLGAEVAEILKQSNFKPADHETKCIDCWGYGCGYCGNTGVFKPIRGRKMNEDGDYE